jgi:exonuclease SbcC
VLFGLGSEKGASLLRTGENEGSIGLIFDVNGKEYTILRTLVRKGKSVQQADGWIKVNERVRHLSPTELKEEVLQILNFNEPPDPKAQSVIYRYAVFTPQEEMKTILIMESDLRLQTLRKAFGIEGYKITRDNASSLASVIDKKATVFRAQTLDLGEKRDFLSKKRKEIEDDEKQHTSLLDQERLLTEKLDSLNDQLKKLGDVKDKLSKVRGEIPLLEQQIREKNKNIEELNGKFEKAKNKLDELQRKIDELAKTKKPTDETEEDLEKELDELKQDRKGLTKTANIIESKIQDYESIHQNKICPTCDREANPEEFEEKVKNKLHEKEHATKALEECEKRIGDIEKLVNELRIYNDAQNKLKTYEEQAEGFKEIMEDCQNKIIDINEDAQKIETRLKEARKELGQFEDISKKITLLDEEVKKANYTFIKIKGSVSSIQSRINETRKVAEELEQDIGKKQNLIKKAELLGEYEIWLKDYFIVTLENIERHVMVGIQQEFNQYFQKWFGLLVEDTSKEARIDENFTSVVEQDGYEQNIYYLSGGEKTSVALAYRLALNSVVQKVSTGMRSNLLILDEPTDGFSKEQLSKVRDILNELSCPQIIIVSHEKELESFADQIFKVTKTQGESKIISGS